MDYEIGLVAMVLGLMVLERHQHRVALIQRLDGILINRHLYGEKVGTIKLVFFS